MRYRGFWLRQVDPGQPDLKTNPGTKLNGASAKPGRYQSISGLENVEKVIDIDQSPIGRTPRTIRQPIPVFLMIFVICLPRPMRLNCAATPRGALALTLRSGRCEACRGDGILKIEMNSLPDVYVPCEVCHGTRYNSETLGWSIRAKTLLKF